jgi:exopolyphosphatase/guanosine-5'-triphosphate,3'-diphosphate pyrophosphatase
MRLAAIDIGTNSVHMIVVQVRSDLSFEVIDREKEMVRLGAGGLDGRKLTPDAMHAALQVLSKFRRLAESHRVDEVIAVATSATREAENGGEFLQTVTQQTGIRPRVISGTEEARLIHLAAVYGVNVSGDVAVVIDIGGGSVEVTRGAGSAIELGRSFKLGVIRLTERFVRTDPLEARDERKMTRHIDAEIGKYLDQVKRAGFDRVIGTSGTILSLGAVASAADGLAEGAPLRSRRISAKALRRTRKELCRWISRSGCASRGSSHAARTSRWPARFCWIRSCAVSAPTRSRSATCPCARDSSSTTSPATARKSRRPIATLMCGGGASSSWPSAAISGPSTRSRWRGWRSDCSITPRAIHGLTDREREWLEYAAILHDLGVHISYEGHHKHSYYLIKNGDLRGFEPDEIETIALVARYHRQATPKRRTRRLRRPPAPRAAHGAHAGRDSSPR